MCFDVIPHCKSKESDRGAKLTEPTTSHLESRKEMLYTPDSYCMPILYDDC